VDRWCAARIWPPSTTSTLARRDARAHFPRFWSVLDVVAAWDAFAFFEGFRRYVYSKRKKNSGLAGQTVADRELAAADTKKSAKQRIGQLPLDPWSRPPSKKRI
jgi:hypothetical protein